MKYILSIDAELWKQFKIKCTIEGVTMIQKLTELIINYLKKEV